MYFQPVKPSEPWVLAVYLLDIECLWLTNLHFLLILQVVEAALADAEMHKDDVDFLVLHQANQRILDSAATRLGVPSERVISNLAEYGNTSAASIPLALDEAVRANTIAPGNVVISFHTVRISLTLAPPREAVNSSLACVALPLPSC